MYNSQPTSQFSNNPFIDDPTNSSGRYPDIATIERSSSAFTSPGPSSYNSAGSSFSPVYGQQTGYGYGMQPQPQSQPQQYLQPQSQQQQSYGGWQQQQGPSTPVGGYGTPTGYRSGAMSPQMTGMPYSNGYGGGMAQYPQQQPQYTGYPSPQYTGVNYPGLNEQGYGGQQQQSSNVSEFDPLKPQSTSSNINPGLGPAGQIHPRVFIRTHKQELEMWDHVTWRQAINAFESLRGAWESHKSQISMRLQQGGYYLGPAEGQRLQGLQKEADHNIDTVTASSVQMQEVLTGYRQSGDLASKNRVRESLNAALVGLPDWPPQNW